MNTDSRINSYATQLQISLTLLLEYFILALFHKKNDNSIRDCINSYGLLNGKKRFDCSDHWKTIDYVTFMFFLWIDMTYDLFTDGLTLILTLF